MKKAPLFIVTGASRGIGRATAMALAVDHGRAVMAVSRDAEGLDVLQHAVRQRRGNIEVLQRDITDPEALVAIREAVAGRRVLGLVNNAGMLQTRRFGGWTANELTRLHEVNVVSPVMLVQALLMHLKGDPPSHVVNIGSMGGFQGSSKFQGMAGYSATKAALANWSESLAEELKDQGVRCNCLALGSVDTEMLRRAFPGYSAPVSAESMGAFVARFTVEGHEVFNGKVLPVALSTP